MKFKTKLTTITAAVAILASASFAHADLSGVVQARHAHMQLYAFNLGQLGAMAKGAVEYNAEAAQAAASNMVNLSKIDGRAMWPAESDEMSLDHTRAKAEIWVNMPDFGAKFGALAEASLAMEAAAGNGLDALRGAMGGVGGACGGCHKVYRAPKN